MSASEVTLMDVPDIAMLKVLKKCDYKSIQTLRKVCHDLRNFIDDSKPDSKFRRISIISFSNSISMDLNSSENPEDDEFFESSLMLNYENHEKGCLVSWNGDAEEEKQQLLANQNFLDVFWNDFRIIMEHQKTILKDFWFLIDLSEDSDISKRKHAARTMTLNLEKILDSRKVRSENLQMDILEKGPLLSILSLMDSEFLQNIQISNAEDDAYTVLTSEDVTHLEQWKNAEILMTQRIRLEVSIPEILHFKYIETDMENLTKEDVGTLKNEFLHLLKSFPTFFKSFSINHSLKDSDLLQILGSPLDPESTEKRWTFNVPGVERVLLIQTSLRQIKFSNRSEGDYDSGEEDNGDADSDDNDNYEDLDF